MQVISDVPVVESEEVIPEEVVFDDGRYKGQPSPETVAGNEETFQVLGAASSSNNDTTPQEVLGGTTELERTGLGVLVHSIRYFFL